jgi:2'-5' RNA ligase
VRCFIALRTDETERDGLAGWLETARRFSELAVTPPANLHLTLEFLGELEGTAVEQAEDAVRAAATGTSVSPGWALVWAVPGAFPSRNRPRVLWLGIAEDPRLRNLRADLQKELRARELPAGERGFRPHLTLARARSRDLRGPLPAEVMAHLDAVPALPPSKIRGLVLYRSILGRGPATHQALLEVAFA